MENIKSSKLRNFLIIVIFINLITLSFFAEAKKKKKKPNGTHAIILMAPEEYLRDFYKLTIKYYQKLKKGNISLAYPFIEPQVKPPAKKYEKYFKYYKKGKKLFKKGKYKYAIKRLKKAAKNLEKMGIKLGWPYRLRRFATLSYWYLGAAQMLEAKIDDAKASIRHAKAIYPAYPIPKKISNNSALIDFIDKTLNQNLGNSDIIVNCPRGFIFIDGELKGVGPTTIKGVESGVHFVTWAKFGYIPQIKQVTISTDGRGVVDFAPERVSNFSYTQKLRKSIATFLKKNNKDGINQDIINLTKKLRVKNLVVFRASPTETEISVFNVDVLSWLKRVKKRNVVVGNIESSVLDKIFKPKPVIDIEEITNTQQKCYSDSDCKNGSCLGGICISNKPFYKEWWFWTAISAGVITLGGGTYLLLQMQNRPYFTITSP